MEYLLLRQHVSALALGYHQVSNCASAETIHCSIRNEISLIAWPLTIVRRSQYYKIKIKGCIRHEYSVSKVGVVMDYMEWVDCRNRKALLLTIVNGHAMNEISLRILHCIVFSEAQFETWWWPSARAETCCLSNKYSTTLLVVFRLYYPVPSYKTNRTGMSQLKVQFSHFADSHPECRKAQQEMTLDFKLSPCSECCVLSSR